MRRRFFNTNDGEGSGGEGGFYADFYFDYCEELILSKYCTRASDDLGVACYNEMVRLIDEYGALDSAGLSYSVQNPINYGFEVYVEGALVTVIQKEYGSYVLYTWDGEYNYATVRDTGELYWEM